MISLIICSRHSDIPKALKDNIDSSIGVDYELVIIDNSENKYSIFSAYNEGVRRSNYPLLCFMHEDILYHTLNWGNIVLEHFRDEKAGLIGVVGTHFLPGTPCGWYHSMIVSGGCIQRETYSDEGSAIEKRNLLRMENMKSIDAVAVDGMWFCVRKDAFRYIQFDELNYNGFHCYDLDICMQLRENNYSVKIVSDILIEHFSYGSFNTEWVQGIHIFYNKWKSKLPQVRGVELSNAEIEIRTEFVKQVIVWITAYAQSQKELSGVRNSKAYRIGKRILRTLTGIKWK